MLKFVSIKHICVEGQPNETIAFDMSNFFCDATARVQINFLIYVTEKRPDYFNNNCIEQFRHQVNDKRKLVRKNCGQHEEMIFEIIQIV